MMLAHVKVDNFSMTDILAKISQFLCSDSSHLITTPNPEMLVEAEHDWFFKQALNQADLAVADGFGLVLATKYLYGEKLNRLAGVDLMEKICETAASEGKSVYLLGGGEGVAAAAGRALEKKYQGLKIVGAKKGITIKSQIPNPKSQFSNFQNLPLRGISRRETISLISNIQYLTSLNFDQDENQKLLQRICQAAPDILFIAFGHGKQEKWLAEFLPQLPSVKIAMGVGGSFDYLAGRVHRAPLFLRRLGLEWLWRLIHQPWRISRIWRAVVIFAFLVRDYKRQIALPYRQGVIGFVRNQEGKFFIAKRHASPSDSYFHGIAHWQPPQGGMGAGETPEQTVVREVKEETGLDAKILYRCQEICQYDWSIEFMRKRGHGYHFRGQQKIVFLLQYEGDGHDVKVDKQELDDYRWVSLAELKQIIHPFRRHSLEILLNEYAKI